MKGITKGSGFHTALFLRIFRQCVHTTNLYLPTGSFDMKTTQNVAGLLKMTAAAFHQTLVVITHNLDVAQLADRVVRLQDGKIV